MSSSKGQSGNTQEAAGTTTALGAGQAMPTSGCSPASLNSPMSSCGSKGSFECGSLEKFMEAWGALSPEGQQLAEKRQVIITETSLSGLKITTVILYFYNDSIDLHRNTHA